MNKLDDGAESPTPATAGPPATLSEEHALLMREVTSRAELVLREADEDRWPQSQLRELVNYLQLEVLKQITDTEWLLFRTTQCAADDLTRLRRDHLDLRLAIDVLTQAAATTGDVQRLSPGQLAAATRDLLAQLEGHLVAEQQALAAAGGAAPSIASLGSPPHEWYSLTEGPVVDLDQLTGEQGIDAVLGRLLRLGPDEQVELRCSRDPGPLWQRVSRADPGGYGLVYLEQGPPRWRLHVTRRSARWSPHPLA